jgi:hypothetical protein
VGTYGKIQWVLTFVNSVARNSGMFLYYPFAYLVLEQQFLCREPTPGGFTSKPTWETCSAEAICGAREARPWLEFGEDYKVDTSYEFYIENWYIEMDLMCTPTTTIGVIITAYYIGYVIGGLFCHFPDKYGRKFSLAFSFAIAIIA